MSRDTTLFNVRWVIVLLAAFIIALLGYQRYQKDVASLTPDQILQNRPQENVRVTGIIQGGSLIKEEGQNRASFSLQGNEKTMHVLYAGQDIDILRELKIIVVTGHLNTATGEFEGDALSPTPNYGYVAGAYLICILPALLFLFLMERRLRLLYMEVKEAKLYEPEVM